MYRYVKIFGKNWYPQNDRFLAIIITIRNNIDLQDTFWLFQL